MLVLRLTATITPVNRGISIVSRHLGRANFGCGQGGLLFQARWRIVRGITGFGKIRAWLLASIFETVATPPSTASAASPATPATPL